jgi:ribosomal protein S25
MQLDALAQHHQPAFASARFGFGNSRLARIALREFIAKGVIKVVAASSKMGIYTKA